jgi:hypothetical protein
VCARKHDLTDSERLFGRIRDRTRRATPPNALRCLHPPIPPFFEAQRVARALSRCWAKSMRHLGHRRYRQGFASSDARYPAGWRPLTSFHT